MSTKSSLQYEIQSLDKAIKSLDVEIGYVQSRLSYAKSQGQTRATIEGWNNDLQNKKRQQETYKSKRREYQSKLRNL